MLLQTVRPNIVQSIRAYRVDELLQAAQEAGQHFLYANLTNAQSKQDVLEAIAESFLFPAHFGKNLDALYDCMTDPCMKSGLSLASSPCPNSSGQARFDRESREQRSTCPDAADSGGTQDTLQALLFFCAARPRKTGHGRAAEAAPSKSRHPRRRQEVRALVSAKHAACEQRVRHRDVVERGLKPALEMTAPVGPVFHGAPKAGRRGQIVARLGVAWACRARCRPRHSSAAFDMNPPSAAPAPPAFQGVAQQLARWEKATVTSSPRSACDTARARRGRIDDRRIDARRVEGLRHIEQVFDLVAPLQIT